VVRGQVANDAVSAEHRLRPCGWPLWLRQYAGPSFPLYICISGAGPGCAYVVRVASRSLADRRIVGKSVRAR
jgi:hypothetical protein